MSRQPDRLRVPGGLSVEMGRSKPIPLFGAAHRFSWDAQRYTSGALLLARSNVIAFASGFPRQGCKILDVIFSCITRRFGILAAPGSKTRRSGALSAQTGPRKRRQPAIALLCLYLIAFNVLAVGVMPAVLLNNAPERLGWGVICSSKPLADRQRDSVPNPASETHHSGCIFCLPLTHPALEFHRHASWVSFNSRCKPTCSVRLFFSLLGRNCPAVLCRTRHPPDIRRLLFFRFPTSWTSAAVSSHRNAILAFEKVRV